MVRMKQADGLCGKGVWEEGHPGRPPGSLSAGQSRTREGRKGLGREGETCGKGQSVQVRCGSGGLLCWTRGVVGFAISLSSATSASRDGVSS